MHKTRARKALHLIYSAKNLQEKTGHLYKYADAANLVKPARLEQIAEGQYFDPDEVLLITTELTRISFGLPKIVTVASILV